MSGPNIPNPVYRIETARLVVRCYEPADAQLLSESVTESVEHLKPWMPWAHAEPEPLEVKVEHIKRFRGMFDLQQDYVYGIFNKEGTRQLGGTGLHTRLRITALCADTGGSCYQVTVSSSTATALAMAPSGVRSS